MTTEVQTFFKDDFQFLEQIAHRNKEWKRFQLQTNKHRKHHKESSFLLHPKRLESESEVDDEFQADNLFHRKIDDKPILPLQDNNNENKIDFLMEKIDLTHMEDITSTPKSSKENITNAQEQVWEPKSILKKTVDAKELKQTSKKKQLVEPFDKKWRNLVEKTIKVLNKIRQSLESGIPPPDGEEDFHRRTKRSQEFAARFSRVYLYPLLRHITEIHNSDKANSFTWLNQKIMSIHQIVWQALQAYYNHLPTSVGKCNSDKLQNLLDQTLDVCQFQQDLTMKDSENDEFINAMRSHTELLLETLDTFDLKILHRKINQKPKNDLNTSVANSKQWPVKNETKLKSRYSMYSVTSAFRKDAEWKRTMELATRKKYNVKSRYKTAAFKHRPPIEKIDLGENRQKLKAKKSHVIALDTPIVSPLREDEIQTMVELTCPGVPSNSTEHLNHHGCNSSRNGKQLVRNNNNDGFNQDCSVVNNEEIKLTIPPTPSVSLQNYNVDDDNKKLDGPKSNVDLLMSKRNNSKEKIISITGTKNAKLICIRDDSSIIQDDSDENEKVKDKEIMTEKMLSSSHTQTTLAKIARPKSCIKISRIHKTQLKQLEMLPKTSAINIIEYKLKLHNFNKNNPLYKKTVHVQPWMLMGRISDDILNDLLTTVTKELEVNNILENLYNAEFQY